MIFLFFTKNWVLNICKLIFSRKRLKTFLRGSYIYLEKIIGQHWKIYIKKNSRYPKRKLLDLKLFFSYLFFLKVLKLFEGKVIQLLKSIAQNSRNSQKMICFYKKMFYQILDLLTIFCVFFTENDFIFIRNLKLLKMLIAQGPINFQKTRFFYKKGFSKFQTVYFSIICFFTKDLSIFFF